jgi:type II secretory pathway pseudopilin PulG
MKPKKHIHPHQGGFIAVEFLFAIIAFILLSAIGASLLASRMDSQNYTIAAQQQQAVADAAAKYLKDNFSAVLASATPTVPAQITLTMLRNTNYLPSGFGDTNAFGQNFLVLARSPAPNQLESIVITTGGETIDEIGTREIAENLGGTGGFIPTSNTDIVQGVRGGWQIALSNYGMNPGVGHTVSALFLQDGSLANDYLYRNAIPGKPELNRMNTALDMGNNNVNNAASVTASGTVTAGGNVNAAGNVNATSVNASANVTGATAKISGETYTGNWFRTQGDSGWYSEKWGGGWYMSDASWIRAYGNKNVYTPGQLRGGTVSSEGRAEVGEYLQLDGVATANTPCSPNGLVGRNAVGLTLSCQDGLWKMSGIANIEWARQYRYISEAELPGLIEVWAACPAGKKVLSGGCNFNGYATQVDFDSSHPEVDMQSWKCGMKVGTLYSYVWFTGIEATAFCANF